MYFMLLNVNKFFMFFLLGARCCKEWVKSFLKNVENDAIHSIG